MTDNQLDNLLSQYRLPCSIDVTDAVMRQVAARPILSPIHHSHTPKFSIAASIAACLTIGALFAGHRYQTNLHDRQLASLFSTVYDYHNDYPDNTSVYAEESLIGYYI